MQYDIARENSYPTPLANSTLLPLMLMSLAMQKNAPSRLQTTSSIYSEYDFIVVGSGSAGSVVASRLSELPCIKILLLEAGSTPPILNDIPVYAPNFFNSDLDWKYKTVPQKRTAKLLPNRQLSWPSGKGFGGTSILNGMLYVRGNRHNYNSWANQGAKGWSYEDALPYFKKLEDNETPEYVANGYHGTKGPITVEKPKYDSKLRDRVIEAAKDMGYNVGDSNGPKQTGFYDLQATLRNYQRCTTSKGYLVPAENRTNLHMLPNAFVHKVIIKNNRAVGVSFEVNGKMNEVKAKREVILSAGTTNSAQILMLSGIGPKEELSKHNIPVVANLPVGKNLQDHLATIIGFELGSGITPAVQKITDPKNIKDYIENRNGPLGSPYFTSMLAFLKAETNNSDEDFPDFELYFIETNVAFVKGLGMDIAAYNQVFKPYESKPVMFCNSQTLHPKSRGSVKLQSSNPHDPPVIDPNYFEDSQDKEDMIAGMKACYKIVASDALKKIGAKPFNTTYPNCEHHLGNQHDYFKCQVESFTLTPNHQVGTAKMGDPQDKSTVVDPQLRVKNIKGLRVVDASVMPIIPSGNTNIPTIMVAEKASDIIKQTIKCS